MIRLTVFFVLVFCSHAWALCESATTPLQKDNPRGYDASEKKISALDARDHLGTLLIGDSLIARWPKDLAPVDSFNFGIAGDRTENVLWRLSQVKLPHATNTVLLIGTNNLIHDSAECVVAGVHAIEAAIRKQISTNLVIIGIPPRTRGAEVVDPKIQAVNAALAQEPGFIDPTKVLSGGSFLMPDGLHLNRQAYEALLPVLTPRLTAAGP